ncbi:hypothetical protein LTR86_008095 [Recurvomyces mirabilis]|nr:hypothetical protein LTR86_008095 [Recurvomyces mirabilis]
MAQPQQQKEAVVYDGPMPKEMFASHTFAENIIKYHDSVTGENGILDSGEMAKLERFVRDPEGERRGLLREEGVKEVHGKIIGEEARGEGEGYQGGLVGYIALKHGFGDVVTREEIGRLRGWFEGGKK